MIDSGNSYQEATQRHDPEPGQASTPGRQFRILLVEDNEMNRDMLSRRLVRKGYSVTIATDGAEGIEMAVGMRPDLILMDMSLPVIDGWEAVRRLKVTEHVCRIPVIALTAHAMSDDRHKAISAGCDEYDTKPVEFSRLLQKMETLLRRGSLNGADVSAQVGQEEPA
jgi:two-component system cell cycle response regulator DivK